MSSAGGANWIWLVDGRLACHYVQYVSYLETSSVYLDTTVTPEVRENLMAGVELGERVCAYLMHLFKRTNRDFATLTISDLRGALDACRCDLYMIHQPDAILTDKVAKDIVTVFWKYGCHACRCFWRQIKEESGRGDMTKCTAALLNWYRVLSDPKSRREALAPVLSRLGEMRLTPARRE